MPIYLLKCSKCGLEEDYIFSIHEELKVSIPCDGCGEKISRKRHRLYSPADAPAIRGETCSKE